MVTEIWILLLEGEVRIITNKNKLQMKKLSYLIMISFLFSNCSVISGGECEPYGEWRFEETRCVSNFWCFFKGQQATFDYHVRQRQCKNGIVEDRKRDNKRCGC